MRRVWAIAAAVAMLAVALAGCGSSDDKTAVSGQLVVSGASSLQTAFTDYAEQFDGGKVKFSFAGSDELAAQIQQGVKPDVYAAASTRLPDELYADGLVEKPTVFAGNRLVIAVPADSTKIRSLDDLEQSGVKIAVGSASVPIGSYTLGVLDNLPKAASAKVLANVRSEEPDVKGIVGKLMQGAVDAGFVYITDVTATKGALKAIGLPEALRPSASYAVAVVKGAAHPAEAKEFIAGLLEGDGQRALLDAGFEPPSK